MRRIRSSTSQFSIGATQKRIGGKALRLKRSWVAQHSSCSATSAWRKAQATSISTMLSRHTTHIVVGLSKASPSAHKSFYAAGAEGERKFDWTLVAAASFTLERKALAATRPASMHDLVTLWKHTPKYRSRRSASLRVRKKVEVSWMHPKPRSQNH